MKASEIIDLAEEVRTAQKVYFRERTPEALSKSKELERRLDKAIKDYRDTQKVMFQ